MNQDTLNHALLLDHVLANDYLRKDKDAAVVRLAKSILQHNLPNKYETWWKRWKVIGDGNNDLSVCCISRNINQF